MNLSTAVPFYVIRRLATTHFEPTYARRAFPCFDEPQLKANFTVTISHHKDHSVFFNMPLKTQTEVKGYVNMVSVQGKHRGNETKTKTKCDICHMDGDTWTYFVCNEVFVISGGEH